MSNKPGAGGASLSIDISKANELVGLGIRRAVAFIALGSHRPDEPAPLSLMLDARFPARWFPQPVPAELGQTIVGEYNAWLTGAGLREAEQYFSVYLNEIWATDRVTAFYGKPLPPDFRRDTAFDRETDIETKFRKVCGAIGLTPPTAERLRGFVHLRTALLHNHGVIRKGDTNEGDRLVVRWLEPRAVVKSGGGEIEVDLRNGVAPEGEVVRSTKEREKSFAVGQRVALDGWELSSIIYTYQALMETISTRTVEHLRAKGLATAAAK